MQHNAIIGLRRMHVHLLENSHVTCGCVAGLCKCQTAHHWGIPRLCFTHFSLSVSHVLCSNMCVADAHQRVNSQL